MNPYRSMLFVPGNKPSWVDKAIASGADAVILDLEDSVPPAEKDDARATVRASVQRLAAGAAAPGVWVRPNAWESRLAGADLEAVVVGGLDGVLLPKIYGPQDVLRFDALLEHFEIRAGLEAGSVEIIVSLETAESMAECERIARASPRIASLFGATARDADIGRALGITWTADGLETLYVRSRILLACRASGLQHPICGLWQDLLDLEGLERFRQATGASATAARWQSTRPTSRSSTASSRRVPRSSPSIAGWSKRSRRRSPRGMRLWTTRASTSTSHMPRPPGRSSRVRRRSVSPDRWQQRRTGWAAALPGVRVGAKIPRESGGRRPSPTT